MDVPLVPQQRMAPGRSDGRPEWIVTGGGLRPAKGMGDDQWIACRENFFLPVKVLRARFSNRFLQALRAAHDKGELQFFGEHKILESLSWFDEHLRPLKKIDWVVYAKRPFAGPEAVLTYLSRYTHRIALSNRRLLAFDERGVTFRYKDYRDGQTRWKSMTLKTNEFIRRFLQHVLPKGFHRIRHYGLFANATRNDNLARARASLKTQPTERKADKETIAKDSEEKPTFTCRQCADRQRAVFDLHYKKDMTHEEVADVLELPLGTVKSDLTRGRDKLKGILKDWE